VKTVTVTVIVGNGTWEKTYRDGEIGEGTDYTIEEWQALSEDERTLCAITWAGIIVKFEATTAEGE
jgi:hypothetical protein